MFEFIMLNLVESKWNTISPGIILRFVIEKSEISTSDSKEAKNEGWSKILDLLIILILPLIIAIIDIFETATDLM